jgi:hypothetical protein
LLRVQPFLWRGAGWPWHQGGCGPIAERPDLRRRQVAAPVGPVVGGGCVAPGLPRAHGRSDHPFVAVTGGHRRPALGPASSVSPVVEADQRLRSHRATRSVHAGGTAVVGVAVVAHSVPATRGPGRDRADPAEPHGRRRQGLRRPTGATGHERRLSAVPRRGHLPVRAHLECRRPLRRAGHARATPSAIDDGHSDLPRGHGRPVHALPRHPLGHRRPRRVAGRRAGVAGHPAGISLGHRARRSLAQTDAGQLA